MNEQIIRCPRAACNHPIDEHMSDKIASGHADGQDRRCVSGCSCHVSPNTIALAAVQTALFGDLTPSQPTAGGS